MHSRMLLATPKVWDVMGPAQLRFALPYVVSSSKTVSLEREAYFKPFCFTRFCAVSNNSMKKTE